MSERTIACPKCGKNYTVSSQMAGKRMKCPACQAVFLLTLSPSPKAMAGPTPKTANPSRAISAKPTGTRRNCPSLQEYARLGLDGPLQTEPELFPASHTTAAQNVLTNYAADPGFGAVDPARFVYETKDPRMDNPLRQNPALTHASQLAERILKGEMDKDKKAAVKKNDLLRFILALSFMTSVLLVVATVFFAGEIYGLQAFYIIAGCIYCISVFLGHVVISIAFIIKAFKVGTTTEAILTIFVPGYVIYFVIKYWSDMKPEFFAALAYILGSAVSLVVLFISVVIAGALNPNLFTV